MALIRSHKRSLHRLISSCGKVLPYPSARATVRRIDAPYHIQSAIATDLCHRENLDFCAVVAYLRAIYPGYLRGQPILPSVEETKFQS
jgi:hypothetical protein